MDTRDSLSFSVAVWTPLWQSSITGGFVGAAIYGFARTTNAPGAIWYGVSIGALAGLFAWIVLMRNWRDLVWHEANRYMGFDAAEEFAEQEPSVVKVEIKSDDGRQTQFIDLPASQDEVIQVAQMLQAHDSLTESRFVRPGLFTRPRFVELRSEMARRGLIQQRSDDPSRGYVLTDRGKDVMRGFASLAASPTPRLTSDK